MCSSDLKTTIVIDHHISNTAYGMFNYVIKDASSTSELIYDLISESALLMNKEMAVALYTGMLTDTGGFMHSCTSAETMHKCAELIRFDFDFSKLYHKLMHEKSLRTLQLQGYAIKHLKEVKPGIYLSYLTKEDLDADHAQKSDVDTIVSFLKSIEHTEVVAFLYPHPKVAGYKLSTRSNPPYDVATFCAQFDGGGHIRAAGGTVLGTIDEATQAVEHALLTLN